MKNKKGFTLAEILGVITILALLGIIIFPIVDKSINESKDNLYEVQISNIKSGARAWIADNIFSVPDKEGEKIILTLSQLKQTGKVDKDITNPITKTLFPNDMLIEITMTRGNYDIEVLTDTGTETNEVEYNPLSPTIVLNGSIIEYFEYDPSSINYIDKGAVAYNSQGDVITELIQKEIKDSNGNIINNISSNNIGEYVITYSVVDNDIEVKTIRTVIVKDTIAPIIIIPDTTTLTVSEAINYNLISTVSVTDASEYTLTTDKGLTSEEGIYFITYTAKDIYSNESKARRKIIVGNGNTEIIDNITIPTAKTLIYNGLPQVLINAGSSTLGDIEYKLEGGTYTKALPSAIDAGTYKVYYRVVGNSNIEEQTLDVTIAKANNTLTLSSNMGTVIYPNATTFIVTNNASGGALSCSSSNNNAATCSISGNIVTVTPGVNASNNVAITVTSQGTANYNSAQVVYTLVSQNGILSYTANGYTGNYDGLAHGISVTSSGSTIMYGTVEGTYNLSSSPTYINVGTYTVYFQITKPGYATVTGSKDVVINAGYRCDAGTLTNDATRGYICVISANQVDDSQCVRYGTQVRSISDSCGASIGGTNDHTFGDTRCNNYGDSYRCTTWLAPYSNCTLQTIIYDRNGNVIADTGSTTKPCCDDARCVNCSATHSISYYCEEYSHSYSYSCPSGWSTYTSSSQCYKAATLN